MYNEDDKKMNPSSEAKMDVIKALRKMAMDMMAENADSDDSPEGVMAEVEMKKIDSEDLPEEMDMELEGEIEEESPLDMMDSEDELSNEELKAKIKELEQQLASK